MTKKGFPVLKDMKVPKGGLLNPGLRKGAMGVPSKKAIFGK